MTPPSVSEDMTRAAPECIGLVQSILGWRLWNKYEDPSEDNAVRYIRKDLSHLPAGSEAVKPVAFMVHEPGSAGLPYWILDGRDSVAWTEAVVSGVLLTPLFAAPPSTPPAANVQEVLAGIEAMLDGQGDDEGTQILPDFEEGMSTLAKVEACLFLLEKRRDAIEGFLRSKQAPTVAEIKEP